MVPNTSDKPVRFGRRLFLGLLGVGAVALIAGQKVRDLVSGFSLQPIVSAFTGGVTARGFRIYAAEGIPEWDQRTWRLRVDGLVANPQTFTFADVTQLPATAMTRDFECVTGWKVKNVPWKGVALRDLVRMVQPTPQARYITFYSGDGVYTDSLTMEQATLPDVILAYEMSGEPLPLEQGQPLRLINPHMYGYKGPKWVYRVEFKDKQDVGYWQNYGYPIDAYIEGQRNPLFG
ncbi:MAG: molybdopterin-dependent oxidoreductase [Dehalococcoidia bacterium]|nr:molybdopterin-dependent oxidoreductase [Dehalococcoidia bacterium]